MYRPSVLAFGATTFTAALGIIHVYNTSFAEIISPLLHNHFHNTTNNPSIMQRALALDLAISVVST